MIPSEARSQELMHKFEVIEHTADIGIRVFGKDEKELFENAARGMFEILADLENVEPSQTRMIKVCAESQDELLLNWLSELLSQYDAYNILFSDFIIKKMSHLELEAEIKGEDIDKDKHEIKTEIKAVTYHQLRIDKTEDGWQAEIIFDV
jgi:SHS2 domain-containing protein